MAIYVWFFIVFIYITYSLSILSRYISSKFSDKNKIKISQGKSVLNAIFGILIFNSIMSLYLSLRNKRKKSNLFYKDNIDVLLPLSMNQFFYLALSFYASRSPEIEGTGEKVSSSILISIYIIIVVL